MGSGSRKHGQLFSRSGPKAHCVFPRHCLNERKALLSGLAIASYQLFLSFRRGHQEPTPFFGEGDTDRGVASYSLQVERTITRVIGEKLLASSCWGCPANRWPAVLKNVQGLCFVIRRSQRLLSIAPTEPSRG